MYFSYCQSMASPRKPNGPSARDSLSVELGGWFRAHATGAGVIAIPIVVAVVTVGALVRWFLA
jgi:hypothetical protein